LLHRVAYRPPLISRFLWLATEPSKRNPFPMGIITQLLALDPPLTPIRRYYTIHPGFRKLENSVTFEAEEKPAISPKSFMLELLR